MRGRIVLSAVALAALAPIAACADEDFYNGRQIAWILSADVGGGYASYARAFAPFFGKHIPGNPNIVIQHMPGAGGIRAMNYLYSVAPKDGTVLGLVHSSVPFAPLYGIKGAKFDPRRINWIGSLDANTAICHRLAWLADQELAGCARAGIHRRRLGRGLADGNHAGDAQQVVRGEDEGYLRLQGRQRNLSGDGARRGRRPLRWLGVVDQLYPSRLVPAASDRSRARTQSSVSGRSGRRRIRQGRAHPAFSSCS